MPYRVFVSYAHKDDVKPIDGGGEGFVTALMRRVMHYFVVDGPPEPEFFRDLYEIRKSRAFKPILDQNLEDADALMVLLSRNWLASDYCKHELEAFRNFRARENTQAFQRRIIVVSKQFVPNDDLPGLLKDGEFNFQEGHNFFEEQLEKRGTYNEYYVETEQTQSKDFNRAARDLAADLRERTQEHLESERGKPQPSKAAPAVSAIVPPQKQRVVFLASPASDVKEAYDRLVKELQGRGYAVVPDPSAEVPRDATAAQFIEAALCEAEVSIHLVGERLGPAPEELENILPLQLRLAAARASSKGEGETFTRIIWAPRIVAGKGEASPTVRDPLAVVERFGAIDGDKIEGCDLSDFVDFVVKHLVEHPPPRADEEIRQYNSLAPNAKVYVWAPKEDAPYALDVADALDQCRTTPVPTIFEDRDEESDAWHQKQLATCDAVLIPWAAAKPGWVYSHSDELKDWHDLGREKPFLQRCVVTGPPNATDKTSFRRFPPRESVDIVLDLTESEKPSADDLKPLFPENP